jgi:hypothetical protein
VRTCSNCYHVSPKIGERKVEGAEPISIHACRINPPVLITINGELWGKFPPVASDSACSKWRSRRSLLARVFVFWRD